MNPPSGFARLKAGCWFILGSRSFAVVNFLNLGIGPREEVCELADWGAWNWRGDRAGRPKTASRWAVAEDG